MEVCGTAGGLVEFTTGTSTAAAFSWTISGSVAWGASASFVSLVGTAIFTGAAATGAAAVAGGLVVVLEAAVLLLLLLDLIFATCAALFALP